MYLRNACNTDRIQTVQRPKIINNKHRDSPKSVRLRKEELCAKVAQVHGQCNTQQWSPGGSSVPRPCGHLNQSCSRKLVITRTQPEPAGGLVGAGGGEVRLRQRGGAERQTPLLSQCVSAY